MHKIYLLMWNIANQIHDKMKVQKKSIFISISILAWCMAGALGYLIVSVLPIMEFSLVNMFMTMGYAGSFMGFFGAAMYIYRNTEPEDLA